MREPTRDPIERWPPNIDKIIPMTDTICDQNSLSHPDLSPVLSPGNAQNDSAADMSPMITGIKTQIARPNVARVKNTEAIPAPKRAITPNIPNISAHQGAMVIRMFLMSLGRWGAFSKSSTSWFSNIPTCFDISFIYFFG